MPIPKKPRTLIVKMWNNLQEKNLVSERILQTETGNQMLTEKQPKANRLKRDRQRKRGQDKGSDLYQQSAKDTQSPDRKRARPQHRERKEQ